MKTHNLILPAFVLITFTLASCTLTPAQRQAVFSTGLAVLESRAIITPRDAADARLIRDAFTSGKTVRDPQP